MTNANETIALSMEFFQRVKCFQLGADGKIKTAPHYKRVIMKDIEELLAGNMNYDSLLNAINRYIARTHPDKTKETYLVSNILDELGVSYQKGVPQNNPDNLVTPMKFYFHPELQITPPPPVITQLADGSFHTAYEQFYLEIREEFTLDDLVTYFYNKMNIQETSTREKDKGAFRHMLKSYDLDFLLHLIDEAYAQSMDRGNYLPKEPFGIQDYVNEAMLVYENRKNICFEGGFDRVIPRTRTQ